MSALEYAAMSAVLEAMLTRRSIRRYTDQPVPDDTISTLLSAAVWAPSAHNRQPWRFVVISTPEVKLNLAEAMGLRLRADLTADGLPPAQIDKDVSRSQSRISRAPLLILLCLTMEDMDRYPDGRRQRSEEVMAIQSTAMAGENLLLAAHSLGLAGCWLCAPLFCPDTVRNVLALPETWQPQGIITLGYAAEERAKDRLPLETRVVYR